jgi:hypothetical protein
MIAVRDAIKERIAACYHGGYRRNFLFRTFPLTSMRFIWVARDAASGGHGFRYRDLFYRHSDW